jgi:tRNA (mo5U34)-methyltransferase
MNDLRGEVSKIRWFHHIDLGHGLVTPGEGDCRAILKTLRLPDSLAGLTVLDIGAWDGFFSFECERRGAKRVLATDSVCWSGSGSGPGWGTKAGFDLAKRALGSQVEELKIDVMDLTPERVGRFDLVLFLGVLYHLRHLLLGLERVAGVTAPGGCAVVETFLDLMGLRRPAAAFYPGAELAKDPTNWWGPNPGAVEGLLHSAGFNRVLKISAPSRLGCLGAGLRARSLSRAQQGRGVFHAWREA